MFLSLLFLVLFYADVRNLEVAESFLFITGALVGYHIDICDNPSLSRISTSADNSNSSSADAVGELLAVIILLHFPVNKLTELENSLKVSTNPSKSSALVVVQLHLNENSTRMSELLACLSDFQTQHFNIAKSLTFPVFSRDPTIRECFAKFVERTRRINSQIQVSHEKTRLAPLVIDNLTLQISAALESSENAAIVEVTSPKHRLTNEETKVSRDSVNSAFSKRRSRAMFSSANSSNVAKPIEISPQFVAFQHSSSPSQYDKSSGLEVASPANRSTYAPSWSPTPNATPQMFMSNFCRAESDQPHKSNSILNLDSINKSVSSVDRRKLTSSFSEDETNNNSNLKSCSEKRPVRTSSGDDVASIISDSSEFSVSLSAANRKMKPPFSGVKRGGEGRRCGTMSRKPWNCSDEGGEGVAALHSEHLSLEENIKPLARRVSSFGSVSEFEDSSSKFEEIVDSEYVNEDSKDSLSLKHHPSRLKRHQGNSFESDDLDCSFDSAEFSNGALSSQLTSKSEQIEYLSSTDIVASIHPAKDLQNIIKGLEKPEWPEIFEILNMIRCLSLRHQQILASSNSLQGIIRSVTIQMDNLRSAVAKNAILTMGDLFSGLGRLMDAEIGPITTTLLKVIRIVLVNGFVVEILFLFVARK